MAETLSELIVKIKADATDLEKGLSSAEKQAESSSKKMQDSLKKIGMAMTASGAAIAAAMGLMGKAAIDEEINIKRLANTINNSGMAYDNVKDSLEAVISATQRKTGVADNEQRDILNRLILVTNDYEKALGLLPTVLDLAAAGQMDATTAATYLGKAYLELEEGAESVSVRFGQASLQFKNMEDIQNRVAGAAENLANPLDVLRASISDVAEDIGASFLPVVKSAVNFVVEWSLGIREFIGQNPALVRALSIAAVTVGALALVLGTATLAVITLGTTTNLYFGGILLIIGAVVTGIVLLVEWFQRGEKAARQLAEEQKAALEEQQAVNKSYYATRKTDIEKDYKNAVDKIRKEYGVVESTTKNKIELAKDASEAAKQALKDELRQARQVHDDKMDLLEREYNQKLKTLNAETEAATSAIQSQIDAIDALTETEDKEARLAELKERVSQSHRRIELARTATFEAKTDEEREAASEEAFAATAERAEAEAALSRYLLLQDRETQKGLLRQQIDAIRADAKTNEERLKEEFEEEKKAAEKAWEAFQSSIEQRETALDQELKDEIARLEERRKILEKSAENDLAIAQWKLEEERKSRLTANEKLIEDTKVLVDAINTQTAKLESRTVTLTTVHRDIFSGGGMTPNQPPHPEIPGFAAGGIVPGPIGAPQLATVHGGETIIPVNESGTGITVNFTQPVFFDREDQMNKFVDMISKGIDRKQRLRFGGAYNGG